jgi:hypothetical protein
MSLKNTSISIAALLAIGGVIYYLRTRSPKDTGIIIADGGQGFETPAKAAKVPLATFTHIGGWNGSAGTYSTSTSIGWDIDDDDAESLGNGPVFDLDQANASISNGVLTLQGCTPLGPETLSCALSVPFASLQITRNKRHRAKSGAFRFKPE